MNKGELSFRELVEKTVQQLEGAFALAFKSIHFPGEIVVTRRGSPLVIGVKSPMKLTTDRFPVVFGKGYYLICFSYSFIWQKKPKNFSLSNFLYA